MRPAGGLPGTETVSQLYSACGTAFGAVAAADTFCVVDGGQVISDSDGPFRALPFALAAGDAGVGAGLSCAGARLFIVADHGHLGICRYDLDDLVGTDLGAQATALADRRVDGCDAVFDGDCPVGADRHAVAPAQTAIHAGTLAAEHQLCALTAFDALIAVLLVAVVTVAAAGDYGYLLHYFLGFHAQDVGDGLGRGVCAGNAEIGLGALLYPALA